MKKRSVTREVAIPEVCQPERLDKALTSALADPSLSRARIQSLIKEGQVRLKAGDQLVVIDDASRKTKAGETYFLDLPPLESAEPVAQKIPLTIVYEDKDLLVINKPVGMVVHPAAGNKDHTLVNALLAHCGKSLSGIGGVARPGIVHRLDKDTSGLMVVAKHDAAHQALSKQFADRSLSRVYCALVWGVPSPLSGEVEGAIGRHGKDRKKMAVVSHGGKEALTYYAVSENFGTIASLVECKLATGRTHQIRVHMTHIKHPVVGDQLYGYKRAVLVQGKTNKAPVELMEKFPRQALHAFEIHFIHPISGKKMSFKAPLPPDMASLLKKLRTATK